MISFMQLLLNVAKDHLVCYTKGLRLGWEI